MSSRLCYLDICAAYHWVQESRARERGLEELDLLAGWVTPEYTDKE